MRSGRPVGGGRPSKHGPGGVAAGAKTSVRAAEAVVFGFNNVWLHDGAKSWATVLGRRIYFDGLEKSSASDPSAVDARP